LALGAITGPNGLWVPSQVMWQANLEPTWEGVVGLVINAQRHPIFLFLYHSSLPYLFVFICYGGDEVGGYCRSSAIDGDWTDIGWRGVEGLGGHLNLAKTVAAAVEDGGEIATAW